MPFFEGFKRSRAENYRGTETNVVAHPTFHQSRVVLWAIMDRYSQADHARERGQGIMTGGWGVVFETLRPPARMPVRLKTGRPGLVPCVSASAQPPSPMDFTSPTSSTSPASRA
jgi:hypothetical protein